MLLYLTVSSLRTENWSDFGLYALATDKPIQQKLNNGN